MNPLLRPGTLVGGTLALVVSLGLAAQAATPAKAKVRLLFPILTGRELELLAAMVPEATIVEINGASFVQVASFEDARVAHELGRSIQRRVAIPFDLAFDPNDPQLALAQNGGLPQRGGQTVARASQPLLAAAVAPAMAPAPPLAPADAPAPAVQPQPARRPMGGAIALAGLSISRKQERPEPSAPENRQELAESLAPGAERLAAEPAVTLEDAAAEAVAAEDAAAIVWSRPATPPAPSAPTAIAPAPAPTARAARAATPAPTRAEEIADQIASREAATWPSATAARPQPTAAPATATAPSPTASSQTSAPQADATATPRPTRTATPAPTAAAIADLIASREQAPRPPAAAPSPQASISIERSAAGSSSPRQSSAQAAISTASLRPFKPGGTPGALRALLAPTPDVAASPGLSMVLVPTRSAQASAGLPLTAVANSHQSRPRAAEIRPSQSADSQPTARQPLAAAHPWLRPVPITALALGVPVTRLQPVTNGDLAYLYVRVRQPADVQRLIAIAPVSEVSVSGDQLLARMGVFTRSVKGQQLMRNQIGRLRHHQLELLVARGGEPQAIS